MSADLKNLRYSIVAHFNKNELKNLCQDFAINHEEFDSTTLSGMARELILHFQRHLDLALLVEHCRLLRPNVEWPLVESKAIDSLGTFKIRFREKSYSDEEKLASSNTLGEKVSFSDESEKVTLSIRSFRSGTVMKFVVPLDIRVSVLTELLRASMRSPLVVPSGIPGIRQTFMYELVRMKEPTPADSARFEILAPTSTLRREKLKNGDVLVSLIHITQEDAFFGGSQKIVSLESPSDIG